MEWNPYLPHLSRHRKGVQGVIINRRRMIPYTPAGSSQSYGEVLCLMAMGGSGANTPIQGVGLGMVGTTNTNCSAVMLLMRGGSSNNVEISQLTAGSWFVRDSLAYGQAEGEWHFLRLNLQDNGDGTATARGKAWAVTDEEPGSWSMEAALDSSTILSGAVGLAGSVMTSGNPWYYRYFSFNPSGPAPLPGEEVPAGAYATAFDGGESVDWGAPMFEASRVTTSWEPANWTPREPPMSGGTPDYVLGKFYHLFGHSGQLVSPEETPADILVVGGGGGGGGYRGGGGGGAGAVVLEKGVTIPTGLHSVEVGGGGTGASNQQSGQASPGGQSSFMGIVAPGGGFGGQGGLFSFHDTMDGGPGASGGGAGWMPGDIVGDPGQGTPGIGHDGSAAEGDLGAPGGGGGAGGPASPGGGRDVAGSWMVGGSGGPGVYVHEFRHLTPRGMFGVGGTGARGTLPPGGNTPGLPNTMDVLPPIPLAGNGGGGGGTQTSWPGSNNSNRAGGDGSSGSVVIRYDDPELVAIKEGQVLSGGHTYAHEGLVYHVFYEDGQLVPLADNVIEADLLVVGGGGGSQEHPVTRHGSGGGAGGVVQESGVELPQESFDVIVGRGGQISYCLLVEDPKRLESAQPAESCIAQPGGDSVVLGVVAYGGGVGRGQDDYPALAQGPFGSTGGVFTFGLDPQPATPGQGHPGGEQSSSNTTVAQLVGGGGGGAGGPGAVGDFRGGGNGGPGIQLPPLAHLGLPGGTWVSGGGGGSTGHSFASPGDGGFPGGRGGEDPANSSSRIRTGGLEGTGSGAGGACGPSSAAGLFHLYMLPERGGGSGLVVIQYEGQVAHEGGSEVPDDPNNPTERPPADPSLGGPGGGFVARGLRRFMHEFQTPMHCTPGVSVTRRPDAIAVDYRTSYSMGPEGFRNPVGGLMARLWRCVSMPDFVIQRQSPVTGGWEEGIPFAPPCPGGAQEVDLAFDQTGDAVIAAEGGGGILWIYYFDPTQAGGAGAHVWGSFGPGRTPRILLDDPFDPFQSNLCVFYLSGGRLKLRRQKDRYSVEYDMGVDELEDCYLEKAYRARGRRFQIILSERDRESGTYSLKTISSTLLPYGLMDPTVQITGETGEGSVGPWSQGVGSRSECSVSGQLGPDQNAMVSTVVDHSDQDYVGWSMELLEIAFTQAQIRLPGPTENLAPRGSMGPGEAWAFTISVTMETAHCGPVGGLPSGHIEEPEEEEDD